MPSNPLLGVIFHWLGGLSSGSFYVPFKGVRRWSWETSWLVGGVFSWIICPCCFALVLTEHPVAVLREQTLSTLGWTYLFGILWGFGGLSYGLTMRYLGLSLGTGVALGYCAAFGTLIPPTLKQFIPGLPVEQSLSQISHSLPGRTTLLGIGVCLVGIMIAAAAGWAKDRHTPARSKDDAIIEFSLLKGFAVATFSGIMSACFAFGLVAGKPISEAAVLAGTHPLWSGLPKLIVLLFGGFSTNVVWCVILHIKNRSFSEYFTKCQTGSANNDVADRSIPITKNYLLSALAGIFWYLQFFFYTMGETQMGKYGFASWTLHMASIIIFATCWGWYFGEWKGSGRKAHALITLGITALVASTIIVGWGSYQSTLNGSQ